MNTNTTEIQKEEEIAITTPPIYRDEKYVPDIHCGKSFPTWMFLKKRMLKLYLQSLTCKMGTYCMKSTQVRKTSMTLLHTWRFFNLKTSSRSKYNRVHKVGKCLGSWICPNRSCTFWATSHEHQPNRVNRKGVTE